ncbi:MAG: hypothetical protein CH104c_0817 [Candidatus Woesebacteria bacterium]|nr:MAG: hypothetical protein CH104c_0817 [Candidatus Woesebacteria bacterium]
MRLDKKLSRTQKGTFKFKKEEKMEIIVLLVLFPIVAWLALLIAFWPTTILIFKKIFSLLGD